MPLKPIILDRTRLEQFATCPQQGYLSMLFDALKAEAEGVIVFAWEMERIADADPELIYRMKKVALYSTTNKFCDVGIEIHELIEQAFLACDNVIEEVPQWFVDNLPKTRPDIQPMAIKHARHIGDMLADYHVNLLAVEQQLSVVFLPETKTRPAIIVTMKLDLLGSGIKSLHYHDWKTGYKQRTNSETADSFQGQFGAWLLWRQPEYKEVTKVHFWYYETLWGTKAYACYDRDEEHPRLPGLTAQRAIQGRIKEAVELFVRNCQDAWPMPEKCCWCDMLPFCKLSDMEAKAIADDPTLYVDQMVVDKESLRRRRAAAVAWIKAKGALVGSKVIFTRKEPAERFNADFMSKDKPKGPAKTGDEELDSHFKKNNGV